MKVSATYLGIGVFTVVAASAATVIIVAWYLTTSINQFQRQSASINDVSIQISRVSTSVSMMHTVSESYSDRVFMGAQNTLRKVASITNREQWHVISVLIRDTLKNLAFYEDAYKKTQIQR